MSRPPITYKLYCRRFDAFFLFRKTQGAANEILFFIAGGAISDEDIVLVRSENAENDRINAEDLIQRDSEELTEFIQIINIKGIISSEPMRDAALGHVHIFGDLPVPDSLDFRDGFQIIADGFLDAFHADHSFRERLYQANFNVTR